jgi:hypothetical protein
LDQIFLFPVLLEDLAKQVDMPGQVAFLDIRIRPDLLEYLVFSNYLSGMIGEDAEKLDLFQREVYGLVFEPQHTPRRIKAELAKFP